MNDLERAVDIADNIANLYQGQEENIEKARAELQRFTNPYAVEFLQTVINEYTNPLRIAG